MTQHSNRLPEEVREELAAFVGAAVQSGKAVASHCHKEWERAGKPRVSYATFLGYFQRAREAHGRGDASPPAAALSDSEMCRAPELSGGGGEAEIAVQAGGATFRARWGGGIWRLDVSASLDNGTMLKWLALFQAEQVEPHTGAGR